MGNDNVMQQKQFQNGKEEENEEKKFENIKLEKVKEREAMFLIQCKKCRIKLFDDTMITEHSGNWIEMQCTMQQNICNCIFLDNENEQCLELLSSMGNISEMEGLLTCFKCKAKLGRFTYCGQQCSCDEWMWPAFQISVSKVDISR